MCTPLSFLCDSMWCKNTVGALLIHLYSFLLKHLLIYFIFYKKVLMGTLVVCSDLLHFRTKSLSLSLLAQITKRKKIATLEKKLRNTLRALNSLLYSYSSSLTRPYISQIISDFAKKGYFIFCKVKSTVLYSEINP